MQRGRDALVNAPTGSGKTLAYLAPIMADLQAQTPHVSRAEGTHALILVPTRELCLQVSDILTLLVRRYIWLVSNPHSSKACPVWSPCSSRPYAMQTSICPADASGSAAS